MSEMYLKVVWKVGWCAERFLVFKYASMHACKYASMHISKQVCKYAIIQVCNLRGGVTKKNGKIWEKFPIRLVKFRPFLILEIFESMEGG